MTVRRLALVSLLAVTLAGCQSPLQLPEPTALPATATTTCGESAVPHPTATASVPSTTSPSVPAVGWQDLPVVPSLSEAALAIYEDGQAQGNHPHAFSNIGDGEIATTWFLPDTCELGPYSDLEEVYAFFGESLTRTSAAAQAGFSTSDILDPDSADPERCESGETPLACELRLHQPSFALISLGTNQIWDPETFERELDTILQTLMEAGVVPILSTKGDNLEGDHRINAIIARLAQEYQLPLWNFWVAIQDLPDQGLQPDGEHLTWAACDFDDADAMSNAWPVRNLTALQVLQSVMRAITLQG